MDVNEQIERFKEFIDNHYKAELYDLIKQGKKSIVISFLDIVKFDHELADELLEKPEDTIRAAELAAEQFDLPEDTKRVSIRLKDLPESQKIRISSIRSKHLDKFLSVEGIVRQASDVRPQVTSAKFECAGCGNTISILQIDTKFKEPSRCTCGWRGKFRLLSKDLIDVQHLKIEEAPESLEGGEQPKRLSVFVKEDLVEPKMEKRTAPGSKINIYGVVKEIPIPLKTGAQSVRYDLILEANNIEPIQEDYSEINITKEDEEKIKNFINDGKAFEKLAKAIAPSIYGHDKIKEALVLQLFGGSRKEKPDGTTIRGDLHVLLVGDPGCIAGDSQVALCFKGMDKIQNLGESHLQKIKEVITKIRKDQYDKNYDFATVFHKYLHQPVLRLVTETGKEIICTYNQPLLTKESWKRADQILLNTKIRVMPKIPNNIKKLANTKFTKVEKKGGPLKEVAIPEYFTEELASLCGYIIGDGHIHNNGYRINCYINEEETDLIEQLIMFWRITFNIEPKYFLTNENPKIKYIDNGNGLLRQIISTQKIHNLEVNSKQVAHCLFSLKNKRVPQQIFQSPKEVIAKFLSWLFEADGCAFGNGRGRTAIQLKSATQGLLKDVQLLLLYFGIHSRIGENNLYIRRASDMELFIKYIGFVSKKKKEKLKDVINVIKLRGNTHKIKNFQRWEKVVSIEPYGITDVYDFEVPISNRFIANGIVCHNSGKSAILQFISKAAPKARFVSGKGSTGAGLCVAPDSLITMNPGSISKIKDLVENKFRSRAEIYRDGIWFSNNDELNKKIFTLDENLKIKPKTIEKYWKLNPPAYMIKLVTSYGKEIVTTPNTKLFSLDNGSFVWKEADNIEKGDYLAGCREFKFENTNKILTISLIKSNPIVEGVKTHIKSMINLLCKNKSMNIRELSQYLGLNENKSYHHWVNDCARGNIPLKDLLQLVQLSGYNLEDVVKDITFLSLKRGCRIKIPVYLNEDFMYLAGLIAGDGNISSKEGSDVIKLSNNSRELQQKFVRSIENLFGRQCYLSSQISDERAEAWRLGSKLIAEILNELGIPKSPKSHRIDMKNNLLNLPNNLLSFFISGYFDANGGPVERQKGGHFIEVGSASEQFAKKLQLVLLRFGIQSKLRVRKYKRAIKKNGDVINAKYNKNVVKISGKRYLELFRDNIGFKLTEKRVKLNKIINSISYYHTNKEKVPGVSELIKQIAKKYNLTSRQIFGYKTGNYFSGRAQISVYKLRKIVTKLNLLVKNNNKDLQKLNLLANSDIIWEEVVKRDIVHDHGYDFVYDLTVGNSHNFIVNGLIVHNTATVVKDEFLRGWALEAGALVLANKGIAIVDELDKMSDEDRSALHQVLEQQQVSISKANIQATLSAETTLLAAANPKLGRFDPYTPIASQIDLPPTLINRFDLIFPIKDIPSRGRDEKIAIHVLETAQREEIYQTEVTPGFLRKYIAYSKQKIKPKMTKPAINEIKDFYVQLRNSGKADDEGVKPIPISARQLEGLVRLAEASAKIRLDDKVTKEDAKAAIDLLKHCLTQVGFDPETGQIDIDKISTGITASTRSKIISIKEIILEFDSKGIKQIPVEEIISEAALKGIEESKVEEAINQLKKSGDIFEPKRGFISKVG